jgi:hypothetical protein
MDDISKELLNAVSEIRDLVRLMAEPAIAERDRKLRDELRRIVGRSDRVAKSVLLMDGSRTQRDIHKEVGINEGQLSTIVKQLKDSQLLAVSNGKQLKLAILVPPNFFDEAMNER